MTLVDQDIESAAMQLLKLSSAVPNTKDDIELAETIHSAAMVVGAHAWMYLVFTRDDETNSYRVLTNSPLWAQKYSARRWYLIDQSLRYAHRCGVGIRLSKIPVQTQGQKLMLAEARKFELCDGYVFPAHGALQTRVGALQAFWPCSDAIDSDRIEALSSAMRTFSIATLDRVIAQMRDELITRSQLTDSDISLLSYSAQGYTSKEIAAMEQDNPRRVDQQFGRIIAKLGSKRRAGAIQAAKHIGLI